MLCRGGGGEGIVGDCGVSEPLEKALRDEFSDRLGGVALVVEVVEGDAEESSAFSGTVRMGAAKEVVVFFKDGMAMGASVLF